MNKPVWWLATVFYQNRSKGFLCTGCVWERRNSLCCSFHVVHCNGLCCCVPAAACVIFMPACAHVLPPHVCVSVCTYTVTHGLGRQLFLICLKVWFCSSEWAEGGLCACVWAGTTCLSTAFQSARQVDLPECLWYWPPPDSASSSFFSLNLSSSSSPKFPPGGRKQRDIKLWICTSQYWSL